MTRRAWKTTALAIALASTMTSAWAGTIGLAWNASAGATSYTVYWGPSPGTYPNSAPVGNVTQATLTNVDNCTESYFAVTASNSAGESPYSDPIQSFPYPEFSGLTPRSTKQGTQFPLTFQGNNFNPNASWQISFEPDPCANIPQGEVCPFRHEQASLTVTCGKVEVMQTADPVSGDVRPAPAGAYTATLSAPDQPRATYSTSFTIDVEPRRMNMETESSPQAPTRVDGGDLALLGRRFNSCDQVVLGPVACDDPEYAKYLFATDFDGNGRVDGDDLALLSTVFGMCWNGSGFTAAACTN